MFTTFSICRAGDVYGHARYTSIMGARLAKEGGDPALAAETNLVWNYKRHGRRGQEIKQAICAFAAYQECSCVLAVPGSTLEPNRLQQTFGVRLERTAEVPKRKYNHRELPADYAKTWRIADPVPAGRVLLVDDVCTTGATLRHYAKALTDRGCEVVCFAVGINARLDPQPALAVVVPTDWECPAPEASDPAQELLTLSEFGRLCVPPMTTEGVRHAIAAGRLPQRAKLTMADLAQFNGDRAADADAGADQEGLTWNQRYTRARALLTEEQTLRARLEREELEGRLHRDEDVEAVWADILVRFRTRLLGLPAKAAPIVSSIPSPDPAKVQAALDAHIREALSELATYDQDKVKAARRRRSAAAR